MNGELGAGLNLLGALGWNEVLCRDPVALCALVILADPLAHDGLTAPEIAPLLGLGLGDRHAGRAAARGPLRTLRRLGYAELDQTMEKTVVRATHEGVAALERHWAALMRGRAELAHRLRDLKGVPEEARRPDPTSEYVPDGLPGEEG